MHSNRHVLHRPRDGRSIGGNLANTVASPRQWRQALAAVDPPPPSLQRVGYFAKSVMTHGYAALLILLPSAQLSGQTHTTWRLGSPTSIDVTPTFGVCLMGGGSEHPAAAAWFLERANGGDVVVLRTSGADGYNAFFYEELGVPINSVTTIRFEAPEAAESPDVLAALAEAEAVWIAGGDQSEYLDYWAGTALEAALQDLVSSRQGAIGGTSAGMAVLGEGIFGAGAGTVYSDEALEDPFNPWMDVQWQSFLDVPGLRSVITDTHYDDPDRRGRHVAFMARLAADGATSMPLGIACDEYTAVCIDAEGLARCFGDWPQYDDFVYFLRPTCEHPGIPESCEPGEALAWGSAEEPALAVWRAAASSEGTASFDLSAWNAGGTDGEGTWESWWVPGDGTLMVSVATAGPNCPLSSVPLTQPVTSPAERHPEGPCLTLIASSADEVEVLWQGANVTPAHWMSSSGADLGPAAPLSVGPNLLALPNGAAGVVALVAGRHALRIIRP